MNGLTYNPRDRYLTQFPDRQTVDQCITLKKRIQQAYSHQDKFDFIAKICSGYVLLMSPIHGFDFFSKGFPSPPWDSDEVALSVKATMLLFAGWYGLSNIIKKRKNSNFIANCKSELEKLCDEN